MFFWAFLKEMTGTLLSSKEERKSRKEDRDNGDRPRAEGRDRGPEL